MKYYKKKKYDKAIEKFVEALEANPANLKTRFNLGCTFSLNGDKEKALGILRQFKEEKDCIPCLERVKKSQKDKDYSAHWDTEEYKAIVDGVSVSEPNYKSLAKKFVKNMGKAYWKEMVDAARANQPYLILGGFPYEDGGVLIKKKRDIEKAKRTLKYHREKPTMDPVASSFDYSLKCSLQCCTVKMKEDSNLDGDDYMGPVGAIKKVCFWPTSSEEARVHVVEFNLYSDMLEAEQSD